MRRALTLLAVLLVVLPMGVGVTAAANNSTSASSASTSSSAASGGAIVSPVSGERIDNQTTLKDARYYEHNATAILTIQSPMPQHITVSGTFRAGEIPRRSTVVTGTETIKLRNPPTEDGEIGVTVSTSQTLFGVPFRSSSSSLGGLVPDERSDLLALLIGSTIGPLLVWIGLKIRRYRRERGVTQVAG